MALMSPTWDLSTHNPCPWPQKIHLASGCSMLRCIYHPHPYIVVRISWIHLRSGLLPCFCLMIPGLFIGSVAVTTLHCLSSSGAIGLCLGNEGTAHPVLWLPSAPGLPLTLQSCSSCSLIPSGHHSCQK